MRSVAIFARGSCTALKWMALFGVVFALGAGQALAQNAPRNVKAVPVDADTVKLTWEPPSAAGNGNRQVANYQSRYTLVTTVSWSAPADVSGGSGARSVDIDSLSVNTEYQFQVRAEYTNPAGESPWTPANLRATPRTVPTFTTPPAVENVDGGAKLTWVASDA